jgi:hypothetical protein
MEKLQSIPPKDSTTNSGWLSPEGKFYDCKLQTHIEMAKTIVIEYGINKTPDIGVPRINCESVLENKNWIKVSNLNIIFYKLVTAGKTITRQQYKYLMSYFKYKRSINSISEYQLEFAYLTIDEIYND